ncbi:MAG TPA: type-F conjugative transfer system pilin assembly protein TrbC [Accumulibacter sp.]|uniref:type-F conjugative transfer system pilin assembly protein TrbC n=1 Tax=Accumulibacter sp. TaxID=2053492 RepID=UPI002C11DAD0|nr:type-F conjugative transfer system pilin assembly protein TrbC [Accumulibacter sp.]HRE72827.1 type-F conjugative transfer system pilin assembly protein TrbC [Accumulibacter sp.]
MSRRPLILLSVLCLGVGAWGGPVTCALAQGVGPSDSELRATRERMGSLLDSVEVPKATGRQTVPDPTRLPQPATTGPDIARMAATYRQPTPSSAAGKDVPELMVFVSFSLPKETLQRIVGQAEKSGAVLVLRGLHGNSLTRMGEEIARLVGDRKVTAIIHPPAFKQFKVHQVPALVLARSGQASKVGEDGCAPGSSFIRVDGDVTQDYALDLIERQAPVWAEVARRYAARLSGSRP